MELPPSQGSDSPLRPLGNPNEPSFGTRVLEQQIAGEEGLYHSALGSWAHHPEERPHMCLGAITLSLASPDQRPALVCTSEIRRGGVSYLLA